MGCVRDALSRCGRAGPRPLQRLSDECRPPILSRGQFLEASPFLNLLLAPDIVRYPRATALDPDRFVYLDGCVRSEGPFTPPPFAAHDDGPVVYLSFGSLGAMDTDLIERMLAVFETLPCRFLVNVGAWRDLYGRVPDNVFLDGWFPQPPSVVAQASLFIHHGGNNSFCEALYYGVPSLVMPYCWDGHDNARAPWRPASGRRSTAIAGVPRISPAPFAR